MDYYSHSRIGYTGLFEIRLSADELKVYEACRKYLIKHSSDDMTIYKFTGCISKKELGAFNDMCDMETEGRIGTIRGILKVFLEDRKKYLEDRTP